MPREQVSDVVADAFERFDVRRMLADPPYWSHELSEWANRYGDERVLAFPTNSWSRMARAIDRATAVIRSGAITHDGDPVLAQHVSNARTFALNGRQNEGRFVLVKQRRGSPLKIDAAVAAVLALKARDGVVSDGWKPRQLARFVTMAEILAEDDERQAREAHEARERARQ